MSSGARLSPAARKAAFITGPLRSRLKRAMAEKPVYAAVSYVSDVSDLPLDRGDTLVCDASDAVARAGSTRKDALAELIVRGVSVWSRPGLHAKVVVAGKRAIVGSANWSLRSEAVLVEASVDTIDAAVVDPALAFVRGLRTTGAVRVDKAFLRRMPEPEAEPSRGPPQAERRGPDEDPRHWLVNGRPLRETGRNRKAAEALYAAADGAAEALSKDGRPEWLLFPERVALASKAAAGDRLVLIWREPGEATVVHPPCLVLGTTRSPGYNGIIYLATARWERSCVPWPAFKTLAVGVGLPATVSERGNRELTAEQMAAIAKSWPKRRKAERP